MGGERRRMTRSLFRAAARSYEESCWCPAADIYRGDRGWLIKFDLAGVRPQDIHLAVEGRRLVVRGVRRDLSVVEGQQAYSMEIAYNRFQRSIELPCDLMDVEIRSEYRDGMFLVSISTGGH